MGIEKKIKPLGSRVLVKRADRQVQKGGILLPDTAQEKPKQGIIMAVGPGRIDEEGRKAVLELKVGDKVLFSSYAGVEVKSEDAENEYLIMSEEDILAVIE